MTQNGPALLCSVPRLTRSCHLHSHCSSLSCQCHTHFTFHLLHKLSFGIYLPWANQKGKQAPQIKRAPLQPDKERAQQFLPSGLQAHYVFIQELLACRCQATGLQHTSSVWSQKLALICLTKHTALLTSTSLPKAFSMASPDCIE